LYQFIRNHRRLAALLTVASAIVAVVAGFWGWELSAQMRGQVVARLDLARGHYEVLSYGLPVVWHSEYTRTLREHYGIEERLVAGCVVTKALVAYADAYNEVIFTAANQKFGRDVFRESVTDAIKSWKTRKAIVGRQ